MSRPALETDYLVVGAGATAMAFVDTLLTENPQASAFIVDRHHRPGGHWNDAYPFVRLHQPSEWYGVASCELSHFSKDVAGPNAPLYGLASGAQVLAYFDRVMRERFLPSGRVQWLPMSEFNTKPMDRRWSVRSRMARRARFRTAAGWWTLRTRRPPCPRSTRPSTPSPRALNASP
ncbi:MAG: hypothetical protein ABI330_05940 [Caldimonas sp.]